MTRRSRFNISETDSAQPKGKAKLLRGLYEDNLRISNPALDTCSRNSPASRPGVRVILSLALIVALFGGLGSDLPIPEPPLIILTPDEVVSQSFETHAPDLATMTGSVADIYGLTVQTIVLDPGHGGRDPGAVGSTGLTEKTVVLDVAKRLRFKLEAYGYTVLMTRDSDIALTVKDRLMYAMENDADLLLSIHINALPPQFDSLTFIETFFFDPVGTESTRNLATLENSFSGFSLADLRDSALELAKTLKIEESKRLAESIQAAVFENAIKFNPSVRDWGTKGGPFAILSDRWESLGNAGETSIPSVLAEISVMSSATDEELLATIEFRESIAKALFEGINNYAESVVDPGMAGHNPDDSQPFNHDTSP